MLCYILNVRLFIIFVCLHIIVNTCFRSNIPQVLHTLATFSDVYIYIRLKIKPNSVRIRFQSCQIFVLPSTGFEPTPLIYTAAPFAQPYVQRPRPLDHIHFIRLKIKPNSVRIRFQSCQMFVLPSTGFEPTPLIHCSIIRLALRPAPSTTSTPFKKELQ